MRFHVYGAPRQIDDNFRSQMDTQARLALGRVSPRVAGLNIYLEDLNGPRGGDDKQCRLVAKLMPRGEVVVYGRGGDWETVIHSTLHRLARTVLREVQRRRTGARRRAS